MEAMNKLHLTAVLFLFFLLKYDPRGGDDRSIFYHYLSKRKRDVLVVAVRDSTFAETHTSTFQISGDCKYLILQESRMVSIANIESLDVKIEFKLIFQIFSDVTYVSASIRG